MRGVLAVVALLAGSAVAAAAALERAYAHLKAHGDSTGLPPQESYGFGRICELMGFPEVWDFEKRWSKPSEAPR